LPGARPVLVDAGWLVAYTDAFARYPQACLFGGKITPVLEELVPAWFHDNRSAIAYLLAERDFGPEVVPISPATDIMPFGANYAVRSEEQRRHPYDAGLGVAPGRMRLGEDTAVVTALVETGCGFWLPNAKVQHLISRGRQTLDYVMRFYQAHGATMVHLVQYAGASMLLGVPRFLWRRGAVRYMSCWFTRATAPSSVWLERLKLYAQDRGSIIEFLSRTSGGRTPP
jgi:hypothetical protein